MKTLRVLVLAGCGLAILPTTGLAQKTKGQKLTEKLISRAEAAIQAISDTEAQYKATLTAYNAIINGDVEDNQKAYNRLVKELNKTQKARETARARVDAMQSSADEYFADWNESLDGISSPELKERSQTRLDETRIEYAKVLETGSRAAEEFEPLIASLNDQINYLGQELNPRSIESLADKAEKLNEQSQVFFTRLHETLREASEYVNGIRSN